MSTERSELSKLRLLREDLDAEAVAEMLTTEYVERVEYDETLKRFVLILDTGRAVVFDARDDGVAAHLYLSTST